MAALATDRGTARERADARGDPRRCRWPWPRRRWPRSTRGCGDRRWCLGLRPGRRDLRRRPTSCPTCATCGGGRLETRGYWSVAGLRRRRRSWRRAATGGRGGRAWRLIAGVLASYLHVRALRRVVVPPLLPAGVAGGRRGVRGRRHGACAGGVSPSGARLALVAAALVRRCSAPASPVAPRCSSCGAASSATATSADCVPTTPATTPSSSPCSTPAPSPTTPAAPSPASTSCRRTISIGCVEQLAAAGRDVWLVADDWEEPEIRRRFAGQARGGLDWAPIAEARVGPARVRVYDLARADPGDRAGADRRGHRRRRGRGRAIAAPPTRSRTAGAVRSPACSAARAPAPSTIVAGASLVLGAAAWASRAVLDEVIADGVRRRIALVPGWQTPLAFTLIGLLAAGGLSRAARPIAPPRATGGGRRRSGPAAVRAAPAAVAVPAGSARSLADGAGAGRSGEVDRLGGRRRPVPVDRRAAPGVRSAAGSSGRPLTATHRRRVAGDRGRGGAGRLAAHPHRALSVGRRAALPGDRAEPVARRRPEDREQPHPRRLPGVLQPPGPGAALPAPRRRRGDLLGASDRHAGDGGAGLCGRRLRRHGRSSSSRSARPRRRWPGAGC